MCPCHEPTVYATAKKAIRDLKNIGYETTTMEELVGFVEDMEPLFLENAALLGTVFWRKY